MSSSSTPAAADAADAAVNGAAVTDRARRAPTGDFLTTAQGVRLPDTDHSLKAGRRGLTLLEDFHLREKITHFDHDPSRNASSMPEGPQHTASSSRTASPGP